MSFIQFLKNLPLIDLGTGHKRHYTKSKKICFRHATRFFAPGKTALDMGCGDGFWSKKLIALGYKITSIDLEKHYENTQVINLENGLPFPDGSFDYVWSTDVLEHLLEPKKIISEIKRTLKPSGLLTLTTPNSYFWIYPIFKLFGFTPKDLQNPDHKQFFNLQDITRLFPKAKIYGFFPYTILKLTIKNPMFLHYLSPSFIIVIKKEEI